MKDDFCIGCGALMPAYGSKCPHCGFNHSFGEDSDPMDEDSQNEYCEDFASDEDYF